MGGHVLGSLDLAQQLGSVTADTAGVDFDDLDLAFRVDHEGATVSQTGFFDQHLEVLRQHPGRVANQRVLDLADGVGSVVPGLVGEVGVGGHAVDFHAQLLELGVVVGQVAQLGRADEGEVGRVEEHHGPFALQAGFGDFDEFALVVGGGFERFDFGIDQRHRNILVGLENLPDEDYGVIPKRSY
ncbi:hypothetical protein D3C85_754690 [compost metagenome]